MDSKPPVGMRTASLIKFALGLSLAGLCHAQNANDSVAGRVGHHSESRWIDTPSAGAGTEVAFRSNPAAALTGSDAALTANYVAASVPDSELILRYANAMQLRNATRQGVGVEEVTIEATLPQLKRQATLRMLRRTSATGVITYTTLDSRGDNMVKREVIARYLAADSQARERDEIAITPLHYRFRLKRVIEEPARRVYVFQLAPKTKKVGLFRGELWVDGQTGLPVHESGRFVKSPSVFIKRISFTRDYVTGDRLGVPVHVHGTIESRIAGRAELDIRFADAAACEASLREHNAETHNAE